MRTDASCLVRLIASQAKSTLQTIDRGVQRGHMILHHAPYPLRVDLRISMDDHVPCADHLSPRNIRRQIACLLTQFSGGLTNHFNVALDERLQILVSKESGEINAHGNPFNPPDTIRDMVEIVQIARTLAHKGTASRSAASRIPGGRSAEGTMSTGMPSNPEIS